MEYLNTWQPQKDNHARWSAVEACVQRRGESVTAFLNRFYDTVAHVKTASQDVITNKCLQQLLPEIQNRIHGNDCNEWHLLTAAAQVAESELTNPTRPLEPVVVHATTGETHRYQRPHRSSWNDRKSYNNRRNGKDDQRRPREPSSGRVKCYKCGEAHRWASCPITKYCPIHGTYNHDLSDCTRFRRSGVPFSPKYARGGTHVRAMDAAELKTELGNESVSNVFERNTNS